MEKSIAVSISGEVLTARLYGEIDHHTVRIIREEIDTSLFEARPKKIVIDFSSVSFMDSSGIALIIGRVELCESIGCSIEIVGLSVGLRRLVKLSGVERMRGVKLF